MEISTLFRPLDSNIITPAFKPGNYTLDKFSRIYTEVFPDLSQSDIVIIGCDEDRGAREIPGAARAADLVRQQFYRLATPKSNVRIADLGNLVKTGTMVEYYDKLAMITWEIVRRGKILILLGGSQDIAYGQYMGYEKFNQELEYVCIDSRLDVEDSDFGVNNRSFNHKIFLHSPNYLFNFTNLGYQSHFVSVPERKRLKNLNFQAIRLGELKGQVREAEPYLRDASLVSVDLACVRSADAPGSANPCPAGFTTEEICQLTRYAGLAHKVTSISFCEAHPVKDFNEQTTMLTAMMAWYFIEGFYNRKEDEPLDLTALTKYRISITGGVQELVFYKNEKTDRWWMEVPYSDAIGDEKGRRKLVPCSEKDYLEARKDEIPEKWWLAHYKLK